MFVKEETEDVSIVECGMYEYSIVDLIPRIIIFSFLAVVIGRAILT